MDCQLISDSEPPRTIFSTTKGNTQAIIAPNFRLNSPLVSNLTVDSNQWKVMILMSIHRYEKNLHPSCEKIHDCCCCRKMINMMIGAIMCVALSVFTADEGEQP